jgi:hypothetical protein
VTAHQAVKAGSSRPRWRSWLPYVLIVLAIAALWGGNLIGLFHGE